MENKNLELVLKCMLTLGLMILNAWIWVLLAPNVNSNGNDILNVYEKSILVFVIAPLVETYIAMTLILDESIRYLKFNKHIAVFVSATVFGLLHHTHWAYMCKTFIDGFFLGYLYVSFKPDIKKAFFLTALVHAIYNIIAHFS
ncbi:MAG: CPBP family intramembrane metalloprotease [Sediminibacterium sp.]|nr:CPBP family intramembrane metalloprotease [Sediminibacterium sp.]MBX9779651.1 CPBP family intramembrane metalloprotease [Chitinophagaceae bacterium]